MASNQVLACTLKSSGVTVLACSHFYGKKQFGEWERGERFALVADDIRVDINSNNGVLEICSTKNPKLALILFANKGLKLHACGLCRKALRI